MLTIKINRIMDMQIIVRRVTCNCQSKLQTSQFSVTQELVQDQNQNQIYMLFQQNQRFLYPHETMSRQLCN